MCVQSAALNSCDSFADSACLLAASVLQDASSMLNTRCRLWFQAPRSTGGSRPRLEACPGGARGSQAPLGSSLQVVDFTMGIKILRRVACRLDGRAGERRVSEA